jgi:hypothetical protein
MKLPMGSQCHMLPSLTLIELYSTLPPASFLKNCGGRDYERKSYVELSLTKRYNKCLWYAEGNGIFF